MCLSKVPVLAWWPNRKQKVEVAHAPFFVFVVAAFSGLGGTAG